MLTVQEESSNKSAALKEFDQRVAKQRAGLLEFVVNKEA